MNRNLVLTNCWAEIDKSIILSNFQKIKNKVRQNCKICCIVKADCYGHGATEIAKLFEKQGIDFFGVANISEGISLREQGIKSDILILGYTNPLNAELLIKYNLIQSIFSLEYALDLKNNFKSGDVLRCHIKINTGMNRLGFKWSSTDSIESIAKLANDTSFSLEGIFTHFYNADNLDRKDDTIKQFDCFSYIINELEKHNVFFKLHHCCNSAGAINFPEFQLDMVRIGASLYGIDVSNNINSREAICLKARIAQIKDVKKGEVVSYGGKYFFENTAKVATITAGYDDGVLRSNSGSLFVYINGKKCKVLGTICMDQFMVDVTGVDCKLNDEVIIYGNGGTPIKDVANNNKTISYEIMCQIGQRVKRIYK